MLVPASPTLLVFISSALGFEARRSSLRKSWFRYLELPDVGSAVEIVFLLARPLDAAAAHQLEEEQRQHRDMCIVDAPEGYENLWEKVREAMPSALCDALCISCAVTCLPR